MTATLTPEKYDEVTEALKDVMDPELNVNVVDLGLIYDLSWDDENDALVIHMTLTSAGCPLTDVLEALRADAAHAQRHGYRLRLGFAVSDDQVDVLGRSGIAITLDPAQPQPLAQLLAAGAQVSFSHSDASPWAGVRNAVVGDGGIGARAAFNAATRFAHRAAGNPEGGVLAPGADADIVRWKGERLVVQVADPRVAAWSTDPRSGTPGLPELSPDVVLPTRVEL